MFCRHCGKEIAENAAFCPFCGRPVRDTEPSYNQNDSQSDDYIDQPRQGYKSGTDVYAIASLVLGILGFICLPIIGGILAIVFGNMSMRDNGRTQMAHIGKILGIVSLVIGTILWGVILLILL